MGPSWGRSDSGRSVGIAPVVACRLAFATSPSHRAARAYQGPPGQGASQQRGDGLRLFAIAPLLFRFAVLACREPEFVGRKEPRVGDCHAQWQATLAYCHGLKARRLDQPLELADLDSFPIRDTGAERLRPRPADCVTRGRGYQSTSTVEERKPR